MLLQLSHINFPVLADTYLLDFSNRDQDTQGPYVFKVQTFYLGKVTNK